MAAAGHSHFLFENSLVKIEKIKDSQYLFDFKNAEQSDLLIRSLYSLGLELKKLEENERLIQFELTCDSIQTLSQFRSKKHNLLGYLDTLKCCLMIGDQMNYFVRNGVVSPYIDIKNVIVIDDMRYLYMNEDFNEISILE